MERSPVHVYGICRHWPTSISRRWLTGTASASAPGFPPHPTATAHTPHYAYPSVDVSSAPDNNLGLAGWLTALSSCKTGRRQARSAWGSVDVPADERLLSRCCSHILAVERRSIGFMVVSKSSKKSPKPTKQNMMDMTHSSRQPPQTNAQKDKAPSSEDADDTYMFDSRLPIGT